MGHEVPAHATRPIPPDTGPRTTHTYAGMGCSQGPVAPILRSSSRGRQEHVQVQVLLQVQLQAPLHEVLLLLQAPLPQLLRQVLLQVQLQAPLHEVLAPAEPG